MEVIGSLHIVFLKTPDFGKGHQVCPSFLKPSKVLERLLFQAGYYMKTITVIPDPRQLKKQHSCVFMVLSQPMSTVQLICPRRCLYITKNWRFHVHAVDWHLQDLQLHWPSLNENEAIWFNNADVKILNIQDNYTGKLSSSILFIFLILKLLEWYISHGGERW